MKGFTVFWIIVFIHNTCCWAEGAALTYSKNIELSCFNVPAKTKSLCAAVTNRFDDVGNDLVLYQLDEFNQFGLIDVIKSEGAHHWLWGLSAGGKYTALATSEEGHSSYSFYLTTELIDSSSSVLAAPVATVSDYYLFQLIYINDDGEAVFSRLGGVSNAAPGYCNSALVEFVSTPDDDDCYVLVKLESWRTLK